ncbi:MAG: hypothetical protein M3457_18605 [Chloroflexota bacterium]|nr:hypothetical protein [Chloroflexota bacterium]
MEAGSLGIAGSVLAGPPASQGLTAQGTSGGTVVIGKPGEILEFDPEGSASQVIWEIQSVI